MRRFALLCGVCLCSLIKPEVPELHCCQRNNSAVYRLHGEVNPDCSIIWLIQDGTMIVDVSGNVDPNTVVSYNHSELTMKSRDSAVVLRVDCLSTGEHTLNCTGLCEPSNAVQLQPEEDKISPLIFSLIVVGPSLVLIILSSIVGVVMYRRLHRSHVSTNNTNDHQIQLQPLHSP